MYYPNLRSIRNAVVITNGYDPEEYAHRPTRRIQPQFLDVGYFGSFYGSRNPELLLQALHRLQEQDGDTAGKVRVHFWGDLGGYPLQTRIDKCQLHGTVIYHGLRPHKTILQEYSTTAVNLIITHRTGSAYALPGKLFEYIGAGKPVWAITDDPILCDFMHQHELGYLSSHNVESVQRTLRTLVRDHATGRLSTIDSLKDFDIATLTRKLERFLLNGCSAVQQDEADGRSSGEGRSVVRTTKRLPSSPLVVGEEPDA
jgi:glycosyltransferase involved in cell wall biosynthesis